LEMLKYKIGYGHMTMDIDGSICRIHVVEPICGMKARDFCCISIRKSACKCYEMLEKSILCLWRTGELVFLEKR